MPPTTGTQPTCSDLCGLPPVHRIRRRRRTNGRPSRLQRLDFTPTLRPRPLGGRPHLPGFCPSVFRCRVRTTTRPERLDRCQSHVHSLVNAKRNIWRLQGGTTLNPAENKFFFAPRRLAKLAILTLEVDAGHNCLFVAAIRPETRKCKGVVPQNARRALSVQIGVDRLTRQPRPDGLGNKRGGRRGVGCRVRPVRDADPVASHGLWSSRLPGDGPVVMEFGNQTGECRWREVAVGCKRHELGPQIGVRGRQTVQAGVVAGLASIVRPAIPRKAWEHHEVFAVAPQQWAMWREALTLRWTGAALPG